MAEAAKRTPLSEPALRGCIAAAELRPVRLTGHGFLSRGELHAKLVVLYPPAN